MTFTDELAPDPAPVPVATGPRPVAESLTFYTPEARLLAEGWEPPVEGLRKVIRQREVLKGFIARRFAKAAPDDGPIYDFLSHQQDDEADAAADASGARLWLNENVKETSDLTGASWQVENTLRKLCHEWGNRIEDSLVGWDTPAADAMRVRVRRYKGLEQFGQLGPLSFTEYRIEPPR